MGKVITRRLGEQILLDTPAGQAVIEPYAIDGHRQVKIRVTAPEAIRVYRGEQAGFYDRPEPAEAACGEQGEDE